MLTADSVIKKLRLIPHPLEGGYYAETYRSTDILSSSGLPERYKCDKSMGTAIYYMLTPDRYSELHRLPSDEIFHYYLGGSVTMLNLFPDGSGQVITLGDNLNRGEVPQLTVYKNAWQGMFLNNGAFALLGTTMSPGYDDSDYERGTREKLTCRYPGFRDVIKRLTRS